MPLIPPCSLVLASLLPVGKKIPRLSHTYEPDLSIADVNGADPARRKMTITIMALPLKKAFCRRD